MYGIAVAVIVGAILGVTFILSSAEGKAKVSETLVAYIAGCFVVFGAFGIWKFAVNTGNKIEEDRFEVSKTENVEPAQAKKKYKCSVCGSEKSLDSSQLQKLETKGTIRCSTCNKQTSWLEVR